MVLDSNGFAFVDLYETLEEEQWMDGYAEYIEGRDKEGNVIWNYGNKRSIN